MPRVRILAVLAGSSYISGEVRDLPMDEAQRLVHDGLAELVRDTHLETTTARRVRQK